MTRNLKPDSFDLKSSLEVKCFAKKPTPLHTTQYPDLFITYKEGFNMRTGKRNPLQLPEEEQYYKLPPNLFLVN